MKISEDYVSYEVAKLLKDKGFDECCGASYVISSKKLYEEDSRIDWSNTWSSHISAPTHQMALKWLREKYSIFVEINLVFMPNTHYNVCALDFKDLHNIQWYDDVPSCIIYEEAVEAGLKYVLENLI